MVIGADKDLYHGCPSRGDGVCIPQVFQFFGEKKGRKIPDKTTRLACFNFDGYTADQHNIIMHLLELRFGFETNKHT